MASAARVFGNSWQTQPRTILSTTRNGTRLGLPRRSTMICCRNTRISASNAARSRNRSTTIPKIILQRSNIPQRIIRFCVCRQLHGIYDRDRKFAAADTVVADAMHAALLVGPRHDVGSQAGEWLNTLASFDIELYCDGRLMDRGHASNILGGPLSAVRHLVELLSRDPNNPPLAAGEIVSTGTLTRALPVKAGETWTTKLKGIDLEGVSLRFC